MIQKNFYKTRKNFVCVTHISLTNSHWFLLYVLNNFILKSYKISSSHKALQVYALLLLGKYPRTFLISYLFGSSPSKNWPSNTTLETFVDIHSTETAENIKQIVDFLQNMILSFPSEQLETISEQEWYSGFWDGKNIC